MRRFSVAALLVLFVTQSSGIALAGPGEGPVSGLNFTRLIESIQSTLTSSLLYAAATGTLDRYAAIHAPKPIFHRPATLIDAVSLMRSHHALRPRVREGVRQAIAALDPSALDPRHRRLDPLAMRRSSPTPSSIHPHPNTPVANIPALQPLRVLSGPPAPHGARTLGPRQGTGITPMTSSSHGPGIEHWWTYEERPIPGIGKAMLNVGTGNLLVSAMDVDVPEQGIDLALQRVYNSQSLHDANGDDGGDPSIFGNRWTSNLDASIVYNTNPNTITVYDGDGTACVYTSNGSGGWTPCTGEYATLAPTDGTDCSYAWTKTNGTVYWFHSAGGPGFNCNIAAAKKGQLQEIFGRNRNNYVTFAYSYDGSGNKTSENVTEIDVNHSDGDSLVMKFGLISGTSINELTSVKRPDGAVVYYLYDSSGNLVEVDKPGNNSAFSLPNPPQGHPTLQSGVVPETYAYATNTSNLAMACGPRCTAAMWANPSSPTDGGALLFSIDSTSLTLQNWQFQGILNFTPSDGTGIVLQANPSTGFITWYTANFVYGTGGACGQSTSGTTTMCDSDGHARAWTIDGSARVTQTQEWTTSSTSVVTQQSWDTNNDLVSSTDANGNTTQYAYDSGGSGNMVEMELPQANDFTVNGAPVSLSPLNYYSYDQNHNVTKYCDPVYNYNHGATWVASPGNNLCGGGNNTTRMTYATPSPEPFGCLSTITKPLGYSANIAYASGTGQCGNGLPTQVQAANAISNYDNTSRRPTQNFTYNSNGDLHTFDKGQGDGGATQDSWTLNYQDNRLVQKTQNDTGITGAVITSMSCYYPDGSLFYTETPSQYAKDGNPSCPTTVTMLGAKQSAQQHATAYSYDLDGDQTKVITHKGCSQSVQCPGPQSITACVVGQQSDAGTTCKYYDGLDRLVETAQPYDNRTMDNGGQQQHYEFYNNNIRWMNRYIYDLSQNGASANLHISDTTDSIQGIVAYGNLYKTQEYLPQMSGMQAKLTDINNLGSPAWNDARGTSFDALDRPVAKYELAYEPANSTTPMSLNTYDCTGQLGLLCQTTNYLGQIIAYTYDNIARIKQESFSGPTPRADGPRTYTYDPDGRTATISAATMGTLSYTYDYDGNKTSVTEPANQDAASLICYTYYLDGLREYLGIGLPGTDTCGSISAQAHPANGGIRQGQLFRYSYRNDGLLATQQINWNGIQINQAPPTFSWVYTPGGRETTETDPQVGEVVPMPPNYSTNVTMQAKSYSYDQYGRVSDIVFPEKFEESSPAYDDDDELIGYGAGLSGQAASFSPTMTLDARGELLEGPGQKPTYSANGTEVGDGNTLANYGQSAPNGMQLDMRSGMITVITNPFYAQTQGMSYGAGDYGYQYDGAGRQTTATQYPNWPLLTNPSTAYSISYDTENHITATGNTMNFCVPNPDGCSNGSASAKWGPDGRQRSSVFGTTYAAHWDGDALLFYSSGSGTNAELYIGKEGTLDLNSSTGNYYISDRDQSGEQIAAHGITASATHPNWFDSWTLGGYRSIFVNKAGKSYGFNLETVAGSCGWTGQQLGQPFYYQCPFYPRFMMQRPDGYSMVGGYVQGARSFDPVSGQWLTPDPYAGSVNDPMSQKPFIWNGNNPIEYGDPSGYDPTLQSQSQGGTSAADSSLVASSLKAISSKAQNLPDTPENSLVKALGTFLTSSQSSAITITITDQSQNVSRDANGNVTTATIITFNMDDPTKLTLYMGSVRALPSGQQGTALQQGLANDVGTGAVLGGLLGTGSQQAEARTDRQQDVNTGDDAHLDTFANDYFLRPLGLCCDI